MKIQDKMLVREQGSGVTRRSALRRGAVAVAVAGTGLAPRVGAAQEASPVPITDAEAAPGVIGTLFTVVIDHLPPPPVEIALARAVSEPGTGDLEDYFTFPGPFAFVVESGQIICRCGTDEDPCLLLHADGTSEPAPPVPADIPLGPGEGLFIPANVPDSYTIPGSEPEVELDLSIFPAMSPTASPEATPSA